MNRKSLQRATRRKNQRAGQGKVLEAGEQTALHAVTAERSWKIRTQMYGAKVAMEGCEGPASHGQSQYQLHRRQSQTEGASGEGGREEMEAAGTPNSSETGP